MSKLSQKYNEILLDLRSQRKIFLFLVVFGIPNIARVGFVVFIFTLVSAGTHGFLAGVIYWCRMIVATGMALEAVWNGYSLWRDGKITPI